jgi:hypothetical protein
MLFLMLESQSKKSQYQIPNSIPYLTNEIKN